MCVHWPCPRGQWGHAWAEPASPASPLSAALLRGSDLKGLGKMSASL